LEAGGRQRSGTLTKRVFQIEGFVGPFHEAPMKNSTPTTRQTPKGKVPARLEQMLKDGEMERIAVNLGRRYPEAAGHANDAVYSAVEKVLQRAEQLDVEKVGSYLFATAKNEMVDVGKRWSRFDDYDEDATDGASFEQRVLDEDVFDRVRAHVRTWKNANVRAVTLAVLDSVQAGEPLDTDELTRAASEILDRRLSPDSVRSWKSRGLLRLQREVLPIHLQNKETTHG
jgi:DNA-directed RNA polymerase specialized sigma24 family protein